MALYNIAAIDIGASSGRVMLAKYDNNNQQLSLDEVYRFKNTLSQIDGHHCWDIDHLEQQICLGLQQLEEEVNEIHSIGIDTWGVDYILLDKNGHRVGPSYSYRDHRTDGVMNKVQQELGIDYIYQRTGIQFLPFNTLYQLKAMVDNKPEWMSQVTDLLMIPDYLNYRLTGKMNREYTNATTTQLVNINTGDWDEELIHYLGLPRSWFGQIRQPGYLVGHWCSPKGQNIPVISIASHDTASAVIGAPLTNANAAYLCSGTWSLMGLERKQSYTNKLAQESNITNEGGINGTYRVLKNIMGLWLFQRICQEHDVKDITVLIQEAAKQPAFVSTIQANDDLFLNPPSMTNAIQTACRDAGQPVPQTLPQLTRCIFDSLALLYKEVANELAQLQNAPIQQLHIVGGGCQNQFLNQLCADLCQLPVVSGPVEASALGNVGCQLLALGVIKDLAEFRQILSNNMPMQYLTPNSQN